MRGIIMTEELFLTLMILDALLDIDRQSSQTAMACHVKKSVWRILAIIFGIITTAAIVLIITLSSKTNNELDQDSEVEWYQELRPFEIRKVLEYLEDEANISLVTPENATLNASFVHYIELKLPLKNSVLNYLHQKGPIPIRFAKAALFRGDLQPPVVEEYNLWPLPNISSILLTRTVPYSQRPLLRLEMGYIYNYIVPKFEEATKSFLKKEYNLTLREFLPSNCTTQCIHVSFTPIPGTVAKKGRREVWVSFNLESLYDVHPLDFQFEADITSVNPSEWTLGRIWYDDSLFDNVSLFMNYYNNRPTKTPWYQKKQSSGDSTEEFPQSKPLPANDAHTNTQRPRYSLTDNFSTVTYLNWKFHLQMSPTGGLRLLNIQYRGEMIVYEMNIQEVGVIYSGSSPAAQNFNFVDGTALFGSRIAGLVEGVDCPVGATFISPIIYTVNDRGFKKQHHASCIFEHDPQVPLRRHKISISAKEYYMGIPDKVLVVRVILSFLSYDYIMDYVFHNNGAVEARVFSTGSLITDTLTPKGKEFGVQINPLTIANVHNHLFNYKVDLDIIGGMNRHSIWRLNTTKIKNIWSNNTSLNYSFDKMSQDLIKTEDDAMYIYDFQTPSYLLFHTGKELNKNGYPRSYRILLSGMSPKDSDDDIFNSIAWAENQLAVTKRKENEETSSSLYALWDSLNPIVDFKRYINNESIVDEDLVAWITIGFRHIPQMENIPCTLTLGTKSSFLLLPYNYFDEDPSVTAHDDLFFPVN